MVSAAFLASVCGVTSPTSHGGALVAPHNGLQRIPNASVDSDPACDGLHNFYVAPRYKLIMTGLQKAGMDIVSDLLCSMQKGPHSDPGIAHPDHLAITTFEVDCDEMTALACRNGFDRQKIMSTLHDPSWTRVVMYREPLARFLAVWGNSCMLAKGAKTAGIADQIDCATLFGSASASFADALHQLEIIMNNTDSSMTDGSDKVPADPMYDYIRPQTDLAAGTLADRETIGLMYDYAVQLPETLFDRAVNRAEMKRIFLDMGLRPEWFPAFARNYNTTLKPEMAMNEGDSSWSWDVQYSNDLVNQFYTHGDQVRQVVRFYQRDYAAFQMGVPGWASRWADQDWLSFLALENRSANIPILQLASNPIRCDKVLERQVYSGCWCGELLRSQVACSWAAWGEPVSSLYLGNSTHDEGVGLNLGVPPLHGERLRHDARASAVVLDAMQRHTANATNVVSPKTNLVHAECAATVAYAFILEGEQEAAYENLWKTYLDGCPAGSYTLLGYWQHFPSHAANGSFVGAGMKLVPTTDAYLRNGYPMIRAELDLFDAAVSTKAPNGCMPQWVQLLSNSTMPLRPCDQIHEYMGTLPSLSLIEAKECSRFECECDTRRPAIWDEDKVFLKASQWSMLRREDAALLVATRLAQRTYWEDAYTPDEHYVPNVLHSYRVHFTPSDLTMISNQTCSTHPISYSCTTQEDTASFAAFLHEAYRRGKLFGRKIDSKCVSVAMSWLSTPAPSSL